MIFRWVAGGEGWRTGPWTTGWRTLPYLLLETPRGGDWRLELADGTVLRGASESMLMVPGRLRHRLSVAVGARLYTRWALVAPEYAPGFPLFTPAQGARVLPPSLAGRARGLLRGLRALDGREELPAQARRMRLGYALLETLLRLPGAPVTRPAWRDERLRAVLEQIERQPDETMTRASLARRAGLSPTRFHYVFKAATGLAPMAYLRQARLRLAEEHLLTGALTVKVIAARCGFASAIYFCRLFRRRHGVTPLAYRAAWGLPRGRGAARAH